MINSISVTNIKTNETIDINKYGTSNFVLESIDWDNPSVDGSTYRVPTQIGESLIDIKVGTREPSLIGYVIASDFDNLGMTWKEYEEEQQRRINEGKKILNRVFSVYQDIQVDAGEYHMNCRPTEPVRYSIQEEENNEIVCMFTVSLKSYNPTFYKSEKIVKLIDANKLMKFPLCLKQNDVLFGRIENKRSIAIVNNGEVPIGCKIKILANGGEVAEPTIQNANTLDYLAFEGIVLQDGDYLEINTEVGKEDATIYKSETGQKVSAIGYIKEGSKFFKFNQGTEYFICSAEKEYIGNIEATVSYTERFLNMEDM